MPIFKVGDRVRVHALPRLDRQIAFPDMWSSPRLCFSQTCGYPLTSVAEYRAKLRPIATLHYHHGHAHCGRECRARPHTYTSVLVVREASPLRTKADILRAARQPAAVVGTTSAVFPLCIMF